MSKIYSGACFCGAVEVEVSGQPEAMGYCHCRSCRSWSASPRLLQDREEPSPILPNLRRTRDDETSGFRTDRRILSGHPRFPVSAAASCQLRRDGASHARRASEIEGFSCRNGRFRRNHFRIKMRWLSGRGRYRV